MVTENETVAAAGSLVGGKGKTQRDRERDERAREKQGGAIGGEQERDRRQEIKKERESE